MSQSTRTIAKEVPCDYHTAHCIVWLVREQVLRLEAGRTLKGTVEADEIYITAGHKGQAPGGGPEPSLFPPRRRRKKREQGRIFRKWALDGKRSRWLPIAPSHPPWPPFFSSPPRAAQR